MFKDFCIFCKICKGLIKSDIILENDFALCIKDVAPKAPIHYIIFPKKHIDNLMTIQSSDSEFGWNVLKMAHDVWENLTPKQDFNLIANNGAGAGQSVFHMHFHFIAGKNIFCKEFSL